MLEFYRFVFLVCPEIVGGLEALTSSRDFLMFMPQEATLRTIYSYYLSAVNVNPEGDVSLSDEMNLLGLGIADFSSPGIVRDLLAFPTVASRLLSLQ